MAENKTAEANNGRRKKLNGVVVAISGKDTASVAVTRFVKHPKYKKYQKRTKKYLVHDEGNTVEVNDKVTIEESNPISKRKRFIIKK